MGKVILIAGLIIAAVGLLIMAGAPIGRLPGDITYRRGNVTFYFPLVTSIIISIVLTIVVAMIRR